MIVERIFQMKTDQCSSCNHAVVCPHQKQLVDLQRIIDQAIDKDITFIKPINVECKHYSSKMTQRGNV